MMISRTWVRAIAATLLATAGTAHATVWTSPVQVAPGGYDDVPPNATDSYDFDGNSGSDGKTFNSSCVYGCSSGGDIYIYTFTNLTLNVWLADYPDSDTKNGWVTDTWVSKNTWYYDNDGDYVKCSTNGGCQGYKSGKVEDETEYATFTADSTSLTPYLSNPTDSISNGLNFGKWEVNGQICQGPDSPDDASSSWCRTNAYDLFSFSLTNSATIAQILSDGNVNLTVGASWGDFYYKGFQVIVTGTKAKKVPEPATLGLLGLGLLGVGVARRRRTI